MKKRFLALFLCCVMVFTLLPAALTTAFATGEADGEGTAPAQETTDIVPGDTGDLDPDAQPEEDKQPEQDVACTCGAAEGAAHAEGCPLYVAPEQPGEDKQPVCTCGAAEGAAHAEGCPLYVAPEQPGEDKQPVCTCGAAEGAAHAEDCPLYVNPEQPGEDKQQPEEEQTDYTEVYEQLMAAETMEELDALLDSFADEAAMDEFLAWLDANDKRTALEEHIAALNEQETLEQEEDTAILPMVVPFTNVGPLLPATVLRRANAPMAVAAANKDGNNGNGGSNNNSGLVLDKKAKLDGNGGYKITMEAYATGQSSTTVSTKPADIVLVLDMSGSMDDCLVCGKSNAGTHDVYKYHEEYGVDTEKHYFIKNGGTYVEVEYCYGNNHGYFGYYDHSAAWVLTSLYDTKHKAFLEENTITPKNSAEDTDQGHVQFYTRTKVGTENCTPRINALKSAVNGFIENVGKLSPDSQIALVKFAGNSINTVGNDTYTSGGYTYNYSQIVKNLTTVQGNEKTLKDAVSALRPAGATRADLGMEHAKNIINKLTEAGDNGHNKVVVMFTDGEPTSSSSFNETVADNAIKASKSIKDANATVYTIGVFAGADGTPVTSLDDVSKTNQYMHLVSSNYKNATSLTNPGTATYPEGGKSYYLSAADQGQLENIFQQISSETGGSSVQYDGTTIIKDIVTPYFTMPADKTDIKLYTAKSKGNTNSWEGRQEFNGQVDIQGNTVSVSGFSFKDNWCGEKKNASGQVIGFQDGKKLIIEFTVQPKDGFLGGNGVPTNDSSSGAIYKGESVGTFPVPYVNVPIKPVTVTAADKNVYLMGDVTAEQLKTGATAKCGDVGLDLTKANDADKPYGLEKWQTKFVKITTTVTPNGVENLTDDAEYTFTATVAPEPAKLPAGVTAEGTPATAQTKSATGKINVFTPELTFKDTAAYYGDAEPTYTGNLVESETKWTHNGTEAVPATMIGEQPTLTCEYAPETGKIAADKTINTPNDFGVAVTVKIGNKDVDSRNVTFQHTKCTDQNCKLPEGCHFLIHVKTCTLTIEKKLAAGTTADAGQHFIFKVTSPNGFDQTVVVGAGKSVTITGLKVGEYTVKEDTAWSWRYTPDQGSYTAELSAGQNNDTKTVTVTNTRDKHQWVTTDVYCKNKFEGKGIQTIVNDSGATVNDKNKATN